MKLLPEPIATDVGLKWPRLQWPGRTRRGVLALALLSVQILFSGPAALAVETKGGSESTIAVPVKGASVPMLEVGGRPVVQIKINGRRPFPFILDTGAMQTVIDSGLATEIGLASSSGEGSQVDELVIGSMKIGDLKAVTAPVSAMFNKVEQPSRGVLSALAFPGYLVTFDYPRKRIAFRKGALPEPNGDTIIGYGADEGLPIVAVKVAGRELKVHLDTGAPFAVSLPTKYKDEVPLTAPAEEKGKARSHAGEFPIFKGTVNGEITIGEYKLARRDVVFTDVVPHPGATPQGQVGYAALRDFAVTLDSANRRIEFAKGASETASGQ